MCDGDADLRVRLEQRLAERASAVPAMVHSTELMAGGRGMGGGAVALVPMPDMQMTPAGAPRVVKQSPFPWLLATLLAAAVGALAVILANERAARDVADHSAQNAIAAKVTAENERAEAVSKTMKAQNQIDQMAIKLKEAQDQKAAATEQAGKSKTDAEQAAATAAEATRKAASAEAATAAAKRDAAQQKAAWRGEQAATLEKLASTLIENGKHGDAVAPAQSAIELREQPLEGAKPMVAVDARFLLGSALMGKGDLVAAEKELLTVINALEPRLPQATDPEKERYAMIVRKLAQLYSTSGKKKEAAELRKKLEGH